MPVAQASRGERTLPAMRRLVLLAALTLLAAAPASASTRVIGGVAPPGATGSSCGGCSVVQAGQAAGSPSYALWAAVILASVAGAVSAVGAIATAEQFPGEGRISGLALGATTATAIFGGLTPYVAQVLTERTGWIMVPGAMIAVVAVLALPILVTLPETAPTK